MVFGPIPSRRLGRSLGINNIPPKTCSYSCVYCQIGLTDLMTVTRKHFIKPDEIYNQTAARISELKNAGERIDYLTFVPDGEPTLDVNLGKTIKMLKVFGIKIAVITNASLIWDGNVRDDLMKADWVSLKIDSVDEKVWRKIDRPHGTLKLDKILGGALAFSKEFKGTMVTETMLVKGVNDSTDILKQTANFIAMLNPSVAYILVATRPPAEAWVRRPDEEQLNAAYQIFSEKLSDVEILTHSEGTDFTYTSDAERELLSILSVHPMSIEAVKEFLDKSKTAWKLIDKLIAENVIRQVEYSGKYYFMKNLLKGGTS
ncbi:MAG: radical SAM protein [Candidatus Kryptoniota bacterium]